MWERIASGGEALGDRRGAIRLVTFADFECPFCRRWALEVLPALQAKYPGRIRSTFRHWPLAQHRFALAAARASLCADAQGRFEAFHNNLFERQDSIGLIPFVDFAERSDVPDLLAFSLCVKTGGQSARLSEDSALVLELEGRGTPLIVLEGVYFPSAPRQDQLDSVIQAIVAQVGKSK